MLSRQIRIIPSPCQYQVLPTHSPSSFSLFLSPFLSFSLLDRFQINLNYIFILSTVLSCQLDLRMDTSRSWLSFFFFLNKSLWAHKEIVLASLFCFHINLGGHKSRSCLDFFSVSGSIFVLRRTRQIVRCWNTCLACLPFFNTLSGMISPVIFSYRWAISVLSAHEVAGDEVSVSPISRNRSCVFFLLNFVLASLTFLVNDGSDKPSKYWRSLYVVGRTWVEVEVCLVYML